jgi:hypothetical protein
VRDDNPRSVAPFLRAKRIAGIGKLLCKQKTGYVLTLVGSGVLPEGIRAVAIGGKRLPSGNFSFSKRTLVGWMSGVEPTRMGWYSMKASATELGESPCLTASVTGGSGLCPFNYTLPLALQLSKITKNIRQGSRIVLVIVMPTWSPY